VVSDGIVSTKLLSRADSQSVKTGPDARRDIGYDAGKKIKGRKRHILVDMLRMLLKAEVYSAGIQIL